jgi:hypothetical protein
MKYSKEVAMKHDVQRLWAWMMLVLALSVPVVVAAGQNVSPAASDNPVFCVTTTLVQVDAVVTDSKGRQIIDLSADDFEILADGHSQPITYFGHVRVAPGAVSVAIPSKAPRSPGSQETTRTGRSRGPKSRNSGNSGF